MNKKVCILCPVHQAFDVRVFHKEARTLARAGYDVTLIAQHDRNETADGIKIMALPRPKNRLFRIFGTAFKVFRLALRQKADIYHFHNPELLLWGVLLRLYTKKPVIYDVHEDMPKNILSREWLPSYSRGIVSRLFTLIERVSFPFFDAVVVAAEDIASHLPHSSKVVAIRNFPSLEIANRIGKREKAREGPVSLIYVGGLTEDRGVREMVEVVNYMKSKARLILVGRFFNPHLEAELRAKAGKEVQFINWVPYEKVFSFLSKANIGLVCLYAPNYIAGSWRNNKLFEYMVAGLPVIASNFPLWKEIIEGNNCGLTVNPLDPQEIARAVEYLIEHPDEARKMGENGRKTVMEKYNWEMESQKLIDLYENLLKGR